MDVGEQLVDRLIGYGIRHVFGYPGGQTLPLYNGIEQRSMEIEHVLMRDERSGAFAADAYARATGTIGVCDATVGPGATNLVSGLVESYCASIPVLAIVSDIPRHWEHRRAFGGASQGFEQRGFLEGCVKWYGRVEMAENLVDVLHACLRMATSGRPGPVILEFPDDVFAGAAASEGFAPSPDWARFPRLRPGADPGAIRRAAEMLRASTKPVLILGGGALHSGAGDQARALVELLQCPFATTVTAKGILPEDHPLSVGVNGRFGIPMANTVVGEADCVVFVGSKAGQGVTLDWTLPGVESPVIHIDVDPEELGKNYRNTVGVFSDARLGLQALIEALDGSSLENDWNLHHIAEMSDSWWEGPVEYKQEPVAGVLKPQDIVRTMDAVMGPEDVFVSDASLSTGWAVGRWRVREQAGRRFFAPRGVAGLGWGLPAAIGVSVARAHAGTPGRVVCLAGDGAWAYSMADVETATRKGLPIVSVLLNNSSLAWNKHSGENRYPGSKVFEDFAEVDYAAAAGGMGARTARVETIEDFEAVFRSATLDQSGVPWVIDARTCPIETPVQKNTTSTTGLPSAY